MPSLDGADGGIQAEFTRPATAGGRAQFLTVWEHDRAGTTYQDIHGRLATPFALHAARTRMSPP